MEDFNPGSFGTLYESNKKKNRSAYNNSEKPTTLDELSVQADTLVYEEKKKKQL
jgi:hypothetical protein